MRRRSVLVLSAVVVGLLAYTPVDRADCAGDPVETIDVPSFRASVATQQTQVWCWAACIEMVINHNLGSRVVSQQEIVTRNYGAPVALPAMSWAQIWANLNILVPNPNGFDYQLSAVSVNGPLDGATAERELKAGRPFLVGVNGQSHVVTCYGAKIRTGPGGAKSIEAIHLFDPWPTSGDK
jgi:hypothetical protein